MAKNDGLSLTPVLYWDDYGSGDPNNKTNTDQGLNVLGVAVDGKATAPTIADDSQWESLPWDVVTDGDDPYSLVAQGFQFHQARAVSSGEAREVFDYQNVVLITEQLAPHFLIALALFKGVAALVPVLVEVELRIWEIGFYIVLDDRLLVFDRGVFLVKLIVNRDTAVGGDIEFFGHPINSDAFIDNIVSHSFLNIQTIIAGK